MVRQKLKLIAAVKVQQGTARQAIFTHYVQFVESENALNKVFPQYRIVQATVFFDGQPGESFKEGGGEQPDTLLAAPVAVFVVQPHALHAAAGGFCTDDKT